ncbi:MAG TPA: proline--tRNA ligase [Acidimicrobiales bacterium]|nr:proline--tRNA ligase [Acidimicrobiales bacterium]
MRMSRLCLRTLREAPGDAEAVSHQLLVRAGYIRRLASGVYTYLPLGWRLLQNVQRVVREEMDGAGGQEMLMPILQPEEIWAETGRLQTMDDILFRLESKGGSFVLGPTHEEVVTATVAAEVDSYRDLPLNVYQIQFKYRDEPRPRFGLLRGREFIMKDAYSFDVSQEAMRDSYKVMFEAYCRIFDRLGLEYTPVEANAGAIGGDVNHEFMVPSPIGEDLFARCDACGYAANVEALGREFGPADTAGGPCPRCDGSLELVRAVEAGHTFQLGLTYSSKISGANFSDEEGREQPFWMGCYGIGISRAPAVIAEQHHDDAGLIWPEEVAPYRVQLLALGASRNPEVGEAADRIYEELTAAGVTVLYDDRDVSPGVKFADADLLGMPTQLVVGGKGLARGIVERKHRATGERDDVLLDQVAAAIL